MKARGRVLGAWLAAALFLSAAGPALAGAHLWVVREVFSNASGTIQFVELWDCCTATETFIGGGTISSLDVPSNTIYTFPSNLASSTMNKHLLVATAGFASLPGAPTPDGIIAGPNSIDITGDVIQWKTYTTSALTFGTGLLPTDGVMSLNRVAAPPAAPVAAPSTPTNFAGQTWKPPGVGVLNVTKMVANGSSLRLGFNTTGCNGHTNHQIVYGVRSQLPITPGGTYAVGGSVCAIGASSPYNWVSVPSDPAPGGFFWFLLQATNGASPGLEGSLGKDSLGNELVGPGAGGSSGQCSMTKDLANTCSQ